MEEGATCLTGGDFLKDWDQWKKTVHEAIRTARKLGMPDKLIEVASVKVGEFLTARVCAESPEEKLIKELWEAGDARDRKVLGKLLFRLMDKEPEAQS